MGKRRSEVDSLEEMRMRDKKKFHVKDLNPITGMTGAQKELLARWEHNLPLMAAIGSAGTGKTFLGMFLGLRAVLSPEAPQKRLIIIRSCVPVRDIGYLPGTLEEKNDIYEQPYRDICDGLFQWGSTYDNLKRLKYVEFMNSSYIRGLTFDNTVVLLDEAQNMRFNELNSVMTRLGENSRMLVCGDMAQDDLVTKKGDRSGLVEFLNIMERMKSATVLSFTTDDIVRSGVVREYLIAKEEHEGSF